MDRENEVSKIFIISLGSKRWGRIQSSGTLIDDWRASNPKREDNLTNQLESLGFRFLCFVLFLRSRIFPLNMFQSFLQETFCMATKKNFWISGLCSRVRPAKLANHSARTNLSKHTLSRFFLLLWYCACVVRFCCKSSLKYVDFVS